MRCPDCNKFVGNELADPELNDVQADIAIDEKTKQPGDVNVVGNVRLVLNCDQCGTELADADVEFDIDVQLEHKEHEDHEVEVVDEAAEGTDRYDGKPGTPSRYRRHFWGAEITGKLVCSCGAEAEFSAMAEEQAGAFNQLN